MKTTASTKPGENYLLWLIKLIAGLLIVVILLVHFVINHLVAPEGLLSYADVIAYYQNPIIPIMEIAFVIFAVAHSLLGVRSIIFDLNPSLKLIKVYDILAWLLGIGSVGYGIWLILVLVARGS